jgi:DNA polymerase (family 10)
MTGGLTAAARLSTHIRAAGVIWYPQISHYPAEPVMTTDDIANALDEIGTLLELKGENAFRANAYHTAARAVRQLDADLRELVAAGRLGEVPGIGDAIREKVTTLVTTGRLPYLERLRGEVPPGLPDLLRLPGLGPKKIRALHDALGIDSLDKLKAACESGAVARLKGFGEKTQQRVLDGIIFLGTVGDRVRIDHALPLGLALLDQVRGLPGVLRAELCGSLRRRRETVGGVDLVASAAEPGRVADVFASLPGVTRVVAREGNLTTAVVTGPAHGEKVDARANLWVVPDELFPAALHEYTGSRGHVQRVQQRAADRGVSLSRVGPDEADLFAALGLEYIPPELREDTGEVEAAERHEIPLLVTERDVRGVFHNHTTYSDGAATLEEMALAAKALGFEYLGIGDHSQSLTVARGMPPHVVRKQWAEIDALNARLTGIRVLKGVECDILADGSLDYPDDLLAGFDYVVASVHTLFGMPEPEMTARVCRALSHPRVTMLGHSTGRLLLRREGYRIDLDEVLKAAARHRKMIEINAQPTRLDLDWVYVKRAKAMGIPIVINPDAHSTGELAYYVYGVNVARRGWLTRDDVFNTRPLAGVMKELERRKSSPGE